MMEAIVVSGFGEPEVLQLQKIPLPDIGIGGVAGDDDVMIKVYAIGVNPVDTYIRSGQYKNPPALPYTPGKDGAGIVYKIGNNVKHLKIGDRVYFLGSSSGSYAQYALSQAKYVYHLPDEITFEQGACLGTPAFTAYRALFDKGHATPGERLLVHGASGGVGLMVLEMAKAIGVIVIGTAGTVEGIEAVYRAGAVEVFNHRDPNYIEEIQAKYPQGFDLCIEMLASTNLGIDLTLMSHNGRVVCVGSRGPVNINPRDIMSKELQVSGVMLFASSPADLHRSSSFVDTLLRNGQLNPIASLILPLENAAEAHLEVIKRSRITVGNIVLLPSQENEN